MTAEEILIHELAQRARVSVRTIRYYIEEGLLPQPKYEGKYSYYKLSYLDRLELIRRLKDSFLPLREIREIMASLTDAEVRQRLHKLPLPSPKLTDLTQTDQASIKPGSRALQYIDRVMDDQTKYRMKGTETKTYQDVTPETLQSVPILSRPPEPAPTSSEGQTWQRILLAPGVELHVRQPLPAEIERRIRKLLYYAKEMFQ